MEYYIMTSKRVTLFEHWLSDKIDHYNLYNLLLLQLGDLPINPQNVRKILKKMNKTDLYEFVDFIVTELTTKPILHINKDLETTLINMFIQIDSVYLKHVPPDRKSFFNYNYVVYKLLQILGHGEYLDMFPLYKSQELLDRSDVTFEKICFELNWEIKI